MSAKFPRGREHSTLWLTAYQNHYPGSEPLILGNRSSLYFLKVRNQDRSQLPLGCSRGQSWGPVIVYINDLPEELSPQVRLFDTAGYLTVGGSDNGTVTDRLSV